MLRDSKLFKDLCDELKLETDMGREALLVALQNVQLLDQKHLDYGPGNIAKFGEIGLVVRCSDKVERLSNLLLKKRTPKHEAIIDSFMDMANYGLIGQMVVKGLWK